MRIAAFLIVAICILSSGARATPLPSYCAPMPDVAWWNRTENIPSYVRREHGGNWESYLAKWQAQLDRMEYLQMRSLAATSPDRTVILRGPTLQRHLANLRKRLQIIECLADGGMAYDPGQITRRQVEQRMKIAGNPVDGNVKAQLLGCQNCHDGGTTGEHPAFPRIAGQNGVYLAEQLLLYQRSYAIKTRPFPWATRHDDVMDHFAKQLTEADAYDLAAYYAAQPCSADSRQSEKSAPAVVADCETCHGAPPVRGQFHAPNLRGQKPAYLAKQLRRFRFYADEPDRPTHRAKRYHAAICRTAKSLSNATIEKIAQYYGSQVCR